MDLHTIFVVLYYLSVFVMLGCSIVLCNQIPSKMQKHALIVASSLLVCCIGYLFLIEAKTAEGLIIGQKLKYAFVTFGMFYMIRFILDYCNYKINNVVNAIFQSLNTIITVVVLTLDHHQLFYKAYWLVEEGGYPALEKEYGVFHTLAIALFVIYMVASLIIAIRFSITNIKKRSSYVWKLLLAVSIPCLAYIFQEIFNPLYDFEPIAFAAFTVMVLVLIYNSKLYDVKNIILDLSMQSLNEAIIVLDDKNNFKGCNDFAKNIFHELNNLNIDENIKDTPSIVEILSGNNNDIEYDNKIYAVTVSQMKNSFNKVTGNVIRIKDVTLERNYTKLLQNKVSNLSTISYEDELTKCLNRRSYEEKLTNLRQKGTLDKVTLWSIDVNGLKKANDTIGHAAGDELIKGTADILREVFNEYGQVYRTGGDEFFVIIDNVDVDNEELNKKLSEISHNWHGKLLDNLSVSAGYVESKQNLDKTIDELVILADQEMYKKKREYYQTSTNDRRKR